MLVRLNAIHRTSRLKTVTREVEGHHQSALQSKACLDHFPGVLTRRYLHDVQWSTKHFNWSRVLTLHRARVGQAGTPRVQVAPQRPAILTRLP